MLATGLHGGDVIALNGPLGAGKTCFVRGLAEGLHINPTLVSSPTFVLCQEYESPRRDRVLAHLDAYRIHAPDELDTIGFDELLADAQTIVVIEWAQRIDAALPGNEIDITFEHLDADTRRLTIHVPAALADRFETVIADIEHLHDPEINARPLQTCAICDEPLPASREYGPFCSQRCKLVDLGRWMGERYVISRPIDNNDELTD
jgi:tRNA threonylcarbamoyladenosine biosynthesis protein TsaE